MQDKSKFLIAKDSIEVECEPEEVSQFLEFRNTTKQLAYKYQQKMKNENEEFDQDQIMIQEIQDGLKKIELAPMLEQERIEFLIEIIKKPPSQRSKFDVLQLIKSTEQIQFFSSQDLSQKYEICKAMTHYYLTPGKVLFSQGTIGTTFYIILQGTVEIWINIQRQKEPEPIKRKQSKDSRWYLEPKLSKPEMEIVPMMVKLLSDGESFGELALIENKPRAATIQSRNCCHFAVLDKVAFRKILKQKETQKLFSEISILAEVKILQHWEYIFWKKLLYSLQQIPYQLNQIVYKQKDPAENFYIIKTGQFKIYRAVPPLQKNGQNFSLQKEKKLIIEDSILGKYEFFGEEELINNEQIRRFSVKCNSLNGMIYDFFRLVYQNHLTRKILKQYGKTKESVRSNHIQNYMKIQKQYDQKNQECENTEITNQPKINFINTQKQIDQSTRNSIAQPYSFDKSLPAIQNKLLTPLNPTPSHQSLNNTRNYQQNFEFKNQIVNKMESFDKFIKSKSKSISEYESSNVLANLIQESSPHYKFMLRQKLLNIQQTSSVSPSSTQRQKNDFSIDLPKPLKKFSTLSEKASQKQQQNVTFEKIKNNNSKIRKPTRETVIGIVQGRPINKSQFAVQNSESTGLYGTQIHQKTSSLTDQFFFNKSKTEYTQTSNEESQDQKFRAKAFLPLKYHSSKFRSMAQNKIKKIRPLQLNTKKDWSLQGSQLQSPTELLLNNTFLKNIVFE